MEDLKERYYKVVRELTMVLINFLTFYCIHHKIMFRYLTCPVIFHLPTSHISSSFLFNSLQKCFRQGQPLAKVYRICLQFMIVIMRKVEKNNLSSYLAGHQNRWLRTLLEYSFIIVINISGVDTTVFFFILASSFHLMLIRIVFRFQNNFRISYTASVHKEYSLSNELSYLSDFGQICVLEKVHSTK